MRYETERTGRPGHPDSATDTLARGLGWFSIALGTAEVFAPRAIARSLGLHGCEKIIAAYGVREIASGVGILSSKDPTPWIWGRVAGDVLDVATVGLGLSRDNPQRDRVVTTLVALLGAGAVDLYCAQALSRETREPRPPMRDYSDRSGWSRPAEAMRGAARHEGYEIPDDMRGPAAIRPYGNGSEATSTSMTWH
ncbi:MAG: cyclase dehydrase [Geminicoccaceae bacterium]